MFRCLPELFAFLNNERFYVFDDVRVFEACQNSNFIQNVLLLFFVKLCKFDQLYSVGFGFFALAIKFNCFVDSRISPFSENADD